MLFEDKDGSKTGHGRRGFLQEGAWDAIHVIEVSMFPLSKDHPLDSKHVHLLCPSLSQIQVRLEDEGTASYCLTSTVMLSLTTDNNTAGTFSLSGSIRRQVLQNEFCTLTIRFK